MHRGCLEVKQFTTSEMDFLVHAQCIRNRKLFRQFIKGILPVCFIRSIWAHSSNRASLYFLLFIAVLPILCRFI